MDNRLVALRTAFIVLLIIASACGEIDPGNEFLGPNERRDVSVAIIGAGFAGLAAFGRLRAANFTKVDVFEASNRMGGRVYPLWFEDGYLQHGAEFVNGADNPIYEMADKLGLVSGELDDDVWFFNADYRAGKCVVDDKLVKRFDDFKRFLEATFRRMAADPESWTLSVGHIYAEKYAALLKELNPTALELKMLEALSRSYKAYYEIEWSAPINKLALRNYASWDDKQDPNKFSAYTLNKYGYAAVLSRLSENLPLDAIHLSTKIGNIDYRGERIQLRTIDGKVFPREYDYVISTVPLGHLKTHAQHLFTPPLPKRKMEAIRTLGFGSILKVFLIYDSPFWSPNTSFVPLYVEDCVPESYLSRDLHTFAPLDWKPNVLVGWLSGSGPRNVDDLSDEELMKHITQHFRYSMPTLIVTEPKRLIRTSWLRDDNFRGTYTFITPEAARLPSDPIELLARPVYHQKRPRILFAGEATHSRIYQTTIGAYLSGRREADRILNYVRGKSSSAAMGS